MKHAIIALLVALAACSSPASSMDSVRASMELAYRVQLSNGTASAVAVSCKWNEESKVFDVLFLSADHILMNGAMPMLVRGVYGSIVVEVDTRHPTLDALILRGRSPHEIPVASFDLRDDLIGEDAVLVGYPLGQLYVTRGVVSTDQSVSTPSLFGASGGPVFSPRGLIGILVAVQVIENVAMPSIQLPIPHMSDFVSLTSLRPWLVERGIVRA